ncbi:MAG: hypothetical protein IJL54_12105 [Prevotella sp.]|nr:hypothetical protein [Prevotella sp.]
MKQKVYTKPMMEEVELSAFAFCAANSLCPGEHHISDDAGIPEDDDSNIFKGKSGGSNIWED